MIIGAKVEMLWLENGLHTVLGRKHVSFSADPFVDGDEGDADYLNELTDIHGVPDNKIMFYVDNEEGLIELIQYLNNQKDGFRIVNYRLVEEY